MKKKNTNKAFTLIELLVVVAIIGILASVGTVAYNGYTAAAQEAAARTKHNTLVKYVSSEMARCLVSNNDTVMLANNGIAGITCAASQAADAIGGQIEQNTFGNFENPYGGGAGVALGAEDTDTVVQGMTTIWDSAAEIQIRTMVVTDVMLAAEIVK